MKLDTRAIEQLKLEIDAFTVRTSILRGPAGMTKPAILRALKDFQVKVKKGSKSRLRIYVPDKSEKATYLAKQLISRCNRSKLRCLRLLFKEYHLLIEQ